MEESTQIPYQESDQYITAPPVRRTIHKFSYDGQPGEAFASVAKLFTFTSFPSMSDRNAPFGMNWRDARAVTFGSDDINVTPAVLLWSIMNTLDWK